MEVTVFLVFVCALLLSWYSLAVFRRTLPPGPRGHPVFGHLLELISARKDFFLRLMQYKRDYGGIFRLRFVFYPVIVLSSPATVREALVDNADFTSERPDWMGLIKKLTGSSGVAFNLTSWPYTRKLTMSSMRGFGVDKRAIERRVHEEIEFVSAEFLKHERKPFDCHLLLTNVAANVICGAVFGKRFDYNEPKFMNLITVINSIFEVNFLYSIPNIFRFVLPLSSLMRKKNSLVERSKKVERFVQDQIAEHRITYDRDNIRDFCDLFIQTERADAKRQLTEHEAFRIIFELFPAGTETISTTLQWFIVYMMYNQDIQEKCRQEIHDEIGAERLPRLDDRAKLPYMEATLLEVQRMASIAYLALPHTATKDIEVGGYTIPKDTLIVPFLYGCHHDYEVWGDPENFRPERWLDEDNMLIRYPAFMPFSVGRRECAGKTLAKWEIFLFGAAFLQRFSFKMTATPPKIFPHQGTALSVQPFEVIIESCT